MSCDKDRTASIKGLPRLQAGLILLCSATPPPGLLSMANRRGLRLLTRVTRASERAKRLLRDEPNADKLTRIQAHMARVAASATAAVLMLMTHVSLLANGRTDVDASRRLAQYHNETHIYPPDLMV